MCCFCVSSSPVLFPLHPWVGIALHDSPINLKSQRVRESVSLNGSNGQICPLQGSSQAKIETTPFKAPPDTLIGIADAPPLGLSRTPRSAVWGAPVVEKCPPLCPRSSDSGGAAPFSGGTVAPAPYIMYGKWALEVLDHEVPKIGESIK